MPEAKTRPQFELSPGSLLKSGLGPLARYGTHQETTSGKSEQKYLPSEAQYMVPRSVQDADHVVENSNKFSSNQRLIPYKVLIGKGINLNARDSTVH